MSIYRGASRETRLKTIREVLTNPVFHEPKSLSERLPNTTPDNGGTWEIVIADSGLDPEQAMARKQHIEIIAARVRTALSERERFIVERRFGLNGNDPHTLEEVGQLMGLSRERVRQIQRTAFEALHKELRYVAEEVGLPVKKASKS